MQNQPAWLRDDTQEEQQVSAEDDGGHPSLADLPAHQRNVSSGAADFVGLGGPREMPYANGDSHSPSGGDFVQSVPEACFLQCMSCPPR